MSLGSTATRSVPVADTAGLARTDVTGEPIAHAIAPRRRRGVAAAMALAVSVAMTPDVSGAATQQELEARVDSLAEQLKAVQAELAELKRQQADSAQAADAQAAPEAHPPVARNQSALPGPANESALPAPAAQGAAGITPAAAAGTGQGGGPSFFGYGELNYSRPREDAAATQADLARFVLGTGYRFDEKTRFVSELELEHAVASSSDPGEIEVEQAYIERDLASGVFARAGLILIPSGTLNENHEPTRYYGVFRNFVETAIIPSTWREGGVALQGNTEGGLRWDVGLTTGFDLSKWDATSTEGQESPLGSIHQELALAKARDLSGFAALNYSAIPGLRAGASVFTGGASQGQPGLPSASITLWEGHARWAPGAWDLAGLYARGHISGTQEINTTLVGNPTLIPQSFFGWYLQAAYRVFDNDRTSLTPFLRYERFNTAASFADIAPGLTPAVQPDHKVWTAGLNWMFAPGVVLKLDYLDFQNTADGDRFDIGLGYQF
jgi:Phosphate-selective porin O and P